LIIADNSSYILLFQGLQNDKKNNYVDHLGNKWCCTPSHLLSKVFNERDLLEAAVSKVMDKGFPTVDVDADINVVSRKLRTSPAVLIEEYGRITGIITRHDVLDTTGGNGG